MTLRITLLALATGLFSLIWIHDRQSPKISAANLSREGDKFEVASVQVNATSESDSAKEAAVWMWMNERILETMNNAPNRVRGRLSALWDESYLQIGQTGQRWANDRIANVRQRFSRWFTQPANLDPTASARYASLAAEEVQILNCPLPQGILPGEYRAVSQSGIVMYLTLTVEDLPRDGEFIARDIYESEADHSRWYFIRVQPETKPKVPAIADRGQSPHRAAIAERRDSESVRQQAGQIVLEAGRSMISRMAAAIDDRNDGERAVRLLWKNPLLRFSSRESGSEAIPH